jgi:8-oxo-dGTP pyrophosphatase MutT (NUDIX family)
MLLPFLALHRQLRESPHSELATSCDGRGKRQVIEAAVMVPVCRRKDGELRLIVVRRGERGRHGGQLAFPGGKREFGDTSLLDTALRETREEIGLPASQIQVLDSLPTVETQGSGFRISPFLAGVEPPEQWCHQSGEIEEVIEVRVGELAQPDARGEGPQHSPDWPTPRIVPFYRVGRYRLWGVSYRILHPLLPRLVAGDWSV